MRALFIAKQLIGDGLYIQPSLEEWAKGHEGWEIDLLTNDDHVACLYEGMGIPGMRVIFEREVLTDASRTAFMDKYIYDFEYTFDVSKAFALGDQEKIHISTAYAKLLGYDVVPRRVKYQPSDRDDHEKGLILLSMQSMSCASKSGKAP